MMMRLSLLLLTTLAHALPDNVRKQLVLQGLPFVTDMAWPDDDTLLVSLKKGLVYRYTRNGGNNNNNNRWTNRQTILDIQDVTCSNGEHGLGAMTYSAEHGVYLYYTHDASQRCLEDAQQGPVNRLMRYQYRNGRLVQPQQLLQTPPLRKQFHNGGKMEFGTDGWLYMGIGDGGAKDEAQNPHNLLGTLIRLNPNGSVPRSNVHTNHPSCATTGSSNRPCPEVIALGLRNPWRLTMRPGTSEFFINDVGGSLWEEVNPGRPDMFRNRLANYGWPLREGPCGRDGFAERTTNCQRGLDGFVSPLHFALHDDRGSCFTGGALWQKQYVFSNFVLGTIHTLDIDQPTRPCLDCRPARPNTQLSTLDRHERVMAMRVHDGDLYFSSAREGGRIYRYEVTGSDPGPELPPPQAVLQVSSNYVVDPSTPVLFTAPQDQQDDWNYAWDVTGNGRVDARQARYRHVYEEPGSYRVTLTVTNTDGVHDTATTRIQVGVPESTSYPGPSLAWNTQCSNTVTATQCAVLEFCQEDDAFGYRVPCSTGQCPCHTYGGPLIRMQPGTTYQLILRNAATEPTNLHTHGLHVVGAGNGDDVTRIVAPGECLEYVWEIAADHAAGTYWYHGHRHGAAERQVGGGAFGMMIVEENVQLHNSIPSWASNEVLLNVFEKHGQVMGNGRRGGALVSLQANEWYRLRVLFVTIEGIPQPFVFDDDKNVCEVHKVATDGVWRSSVPGPSAKTYAMTGASRADFAVRCSTPGSMVTVRYGSGTAATLYIGQAELNPHSMEEWQPNRPYYLQDLRQLPVPDGNQMSLRLGYDHINDLHWNPDVPMATLAYDQIHEWTLRGTQEHPFHLHLYHLQIVTPGGCGVYEEGEYYDAIAAPGSCTVRFRTADIGQRCVLHCHVLVHEDNGSMAWMDVTGPNMPVNTVDSPSYTCFRDGSIRDPELLEPSRPANPKPPVGDIPIACIPTPIVVQGESILTGKSYPNPNGDMYLALERTGSLVLHDTVTTRLWSSPAAPSNMFRETSSFYSRVQRDGNVVTRSGTPRQKGPVVWSTKTHRQRGNYFLGFDCEGSISLFQGDDPEVAAPIWTARD